MIPTETYFIIGLGLILIFLAHQFKKPIYFLFSAVVFFFAGINTLANGMIYKIGEYSITNTSIINLTTINNTYIFQATPTISTGIWTTFFWLITVYLLFDGGLQVAKDKKEPR